MGTTETTTRARLTALAAVVAGLGAGFGGARGLVPLVQWDPGAWALVVVGVLTAAAALVLGLSAARRADRTSLGFAVAALCTSLAGLGIGSPAFPAGTILTTAAQALLIAFGILVARSGSGASRVVGWVVAVGAAVWLLGGPALWLGTLAGTTQTELAILFAVPAAGRVVAFVVAALLFAGPLVRPVGDGARFLWSTADVR